MEENEMEGILREENVKRKKRRKYINYAGKLVTIINGELRKKQEEEITKRRNLLSRGIGLLSCHQTE
jgi:hypothetical protein